MVEFYKVVKWSAILCWDNTGALKLSSHNRRRIRPSAKCTDIRQNFCAIKQSFTCTFKYIHVYGHMDQYLEWEQLTFIQQLNCVCDTLAKRAFTTATLHGYHSKQSHALPKEDVVLIIWRSKVKGDILLPLRFHASKEVAHQHLGTRRKDKWSNESSMQWTGSTWTWHIRKRPTCTRFGGLSKIWDSVAQRSRLAFSPATLARTNDI